MWGFFRTFAYDSENSLSRLNLIVMKHFSFSDVPDDWAICYQADCPLADQCLRRQAAMLAPESLTSHAVVLPAARKGNGTCCAFVGNQPVQLAFGMKELFAEVPTDDVRKLRQRVLNVFSSKSRYYRYRAGQYPITTSQQARIARLFGQLTGTAVPHYDRMEEGYEFPAVGK
jgi:hypothetical protein